MISLRLLFSNIYYNYTKQIKNYKSNAIAFSGAWQEGGMPKSHKGYPADELQWPEAICLRDQRPQSQGLRNKRKYKEKMGIYCTIFKDLIVKKWISNLEGMLSPLA